MRKTMKNCNTRGIDTLVFYDEKTFLIFKVVGVVYRFLEKMFVFIICAKKYILTVFVT